MNLLSVSYSTFFLSADIEVIHFYFYNVVQFLKYKFVLTKGINIVTLLLRGELFFTNLHFL